MSEHRVSMLGASWRRFEDPTRSRDPRVRELVGALAALPAPHPRPDFRAELRAQLVAITPRIVAEARGDTPAMIDIVPRPAPAPRAAAAPAPAGRARHSDRLADRVLAALRHVPIGRSIRIAVSVAAAFAVLLGGAVWMSQKALPGDALYGLKRASERVELATAGSPGAEARDHLEFAATRADEVRGLLSRASVSAAGTGPQAAGVVDPGTAALITSTLNSADSDVQAAAQLLGDQAVDQHSATPLTTMEAWAPGQMTRLQSIAAAMPDAALRARTESSAQLVDAALVRAKTLAPKVGCGCLGSSGTDSLGPRPCGVCTTPTAAPSAPSSSQQPGGKAQTTTAPVRRTSPARGPAGPATTPPAGPAARTSGSAASTGTRPGVPLPTLPTLLNPTSLPVSVQSCQIDANIGPIGIGVALCPIQIKISTHP